MICSQAPQLTETELLMALDGEASAEVTRHIDQCPACQDRLLQLRTLQDRLASRLFRADCPSSLDVGDYHLGLLPAAQALAVERHLTACPWCSGESTVLAEFLADSRQAARIDLLAPVRQGVKVLVARLSSPLTTDGLLGQPSLAPAFAGLRGTAEGPLLYEADGVQVMADVVDDSTHPGRKSIFGLVTGAVPLGAFQAYLWQAATHCTTTPVDDFGNFAIDNLAPGDYSLVLSGPELEIHLEDLPVFTH
jgi:hypothetical protein